MEAGYWKSEAQTRDVVDEDGWMHTGDLATIDDRGFCRIVGRCKDQISRGGEKVSPVEVENTIFQLEGVQNVSVIGVPDPKFGEEVCAWVSTKAGHKNVTLKEIQVFCKERLAHYKVPRYLVFKEDVELPLTPSGKIQKNVLRERCGELLKLTPPRS